MSEAKIIDGKAFAAGLRARIGRQVTALKAGHGITPGLAAVLVGDDPALPADLVDPLRRMRGAADRAEREAGGEPLEPS